MRCPVCKSNDLEVIATQSNFKTITHRYRVCKTCGSQFQTTETLLEGTVHENLYSTLFDEDNKLYEETACDHCKYNKKKK